MMLLLVLAMAVAPSIEWIQPGLSASEMRFYADRFYFRSVDGIHKIGWVRCLPRPGTEREVGDRRLQDWQCRLLIASVPSVQGRTVSLCLKHPRYPETCSSRVLAVPRYPVDQSTSGETK